MNEVNNNILVPPTRRLAGILRRGWNKKYSDHMKWNTRYYKWISKDDSSHFIYVNFAEKDPGVFTVSAYNTSGFSGNEAIEKYLDE